MAYKLEKPLSEEQKADFIYERCHSLGLQFKESETAVYALEAWEALEGDTVVDNTEEYTKQQEQEERQRLNGLFLTAADVERGIYRAKGMDFDDIIGLAAISPAIDIKALKIELKANNFYRGNPYVSEIGYILGFSEEQLDKFFKTNDYKELLPKEEEAEEQTNSAGGASDASSNVPAIEEG